MSKNKFNNKILHNICFNEMEQNEDGTLLKVKLLIHDFNRTPNGWGITKDTALQRMQYLVNKPIKTKYYNEEDNNGVDFLGDHEEGSVKLRGTDKDIPSTNTDSIGVINNVYIDYIDSENENLGEALWADGVLWLAENINVCNLLYEWHTNGIKILTSVEWLYSQSIKDSEGTEWIADPLYSALCVLNSEAKGEQPVIYGNYDVAKLSLMLNQKQYSEFEDAVESDLNNKKENTKKEDDKVENIFIKSLNELSFSEVEMGIYDSLSKIMSADEFYNVYISSWNVYDGYFLYSTYVEDEYKLFKVNYTKSEDGVEVDYENRKQVKREEVLVEVAQFNEVETKLSELELKVNETEEKLGLEQASKVELNETIASLNTKIEEANATVEELTPFKEQVELAEQERLVNEQIEVYKEKFNAIGGEEIFVSDETQELIKKTLNKENGTDAKLALSDMLFGLAIKANENKEQKETKKNSYKEMNSKMDNLIPTASKFEDNYGFTVK